MIILLIITVW